MFPDDADEILAKIPPTTEYIIEAVMDLLDIQSRASGLMRVFAKMGIADPEWKIFTFYHESGHCRSFMIS